MGLPHTLQKGGLAVLMLTLLGCGAGRLSDPHLKTLDRQRIETLLRGAGIEGWFEVRRNGRGSAIIISAHDAATKSGVAVWVDVDGHADVIRGSAPFMEFNDRREVVATYESLRLGVRFANGEVVALAPFGKFRVAPGGEYFLAEVAPGVTEIRRTAAPTAAMVSAPVRGEWLFEKEGRLYLFSRTLAGPLKSGETKQDGIECRVFRTTSAGTELAERILIPRPVARTSPFYVVDLDPWSNRVLLGEDRDVPFDFLSAWYTFDLSTRELRKFERSKGFAFFLSGDPLKAAGP